MSIKLRHDIVHWEWLYHSNIKLVRHFCQLYNDTSYYWVALFLWYGLRIFFSKTDINCSNYGGVLTFECRVRSGSVLARNHIFRARISKLWNLLARNFTSRWVIFPLAANTICFVCFNTMHYGILVTSPLPWFRS